MNLAGPFLAAYLLDLVLGDPHGWPHPVRWIGRAVAFWERVLYGTSFWRGALFWSAVTASVIGPVLGLVWGVSRAPGVVQALLFTYLLYAGLATRSLHLENMRVIRSLERENLEEARERLSWIVGRDTERLSPEGIRCAVIENLSENLSDGVVAPIFYGLLAGVPGMMLYKTVNTMDSMVGYRNPRYLAFGRTAARADDGFSWVPARVTALLLLTCSLLAGRDTAQAWRVLRRDGRKPKSPNAGLPEAAMAGALGIRLGGPAWYFGKKVEKPFLGDGNHEVCTADIRAAAQMLYGTSLLMAGLAWIGMLAAEAGPWGLIGVLFR